MAVPSYTTDLTTISLAENSGTWGEFTGYADGGAPDITEADFKLQGSYCVAQTMSKSTVCSIYVDYGSPITITSPQAVFVWTMWAYGGNVDTYANGGIRTVIGSAAAVWKAWYVGGSDKAPFPKGGWYNYATDPTCSTDQTSGSAGTSYRYFGSAVKPASAPNRGTCHLVDAMRYGRGEAQMSGGESANYCTIAGFAATNDLSGNRWGLIEAVAGGYLWKGLMGLGISGAVDFRDSNVNMYVQDCTKVMSGFTSVNVANTASNVDMTNFNFIALGTNARGMLSAVNNVDLSLDTCSFTDFGPLYLCPSASVNDCTFRRTEMITQSGATIDGCTFDSCRTAVTVSADAIDLISNCYFISDGGNHAIEISTLGASAAYTITNLTYSGYASAGSGTSGNECIYNNSGQHVKLTIDGGDEPSYKNGTSATTEIVVGQRILTLTGVVSGSEIRIYTAGTTTELGGIETFEPVGSTGDWDYTYTYASSTYVDIVIHKANYIYYRIDDYLLLDANSSIPISQQPDRQYSNP